MKRIIDIDEEWFESIIASKDHIDKDDEAYLILNSIPYEEIPQGNLISREALKKALCEEYEAREHYIGEIMLKAIDNAPAVNIKDQIAGAYNEGYMCGNKEAEKGRPQGEWIFRSGGYYKCNKCGEVERAEKNFCPNCGAKMKAVRE